MQLENFKPCLVIQIPIQRDKARIPFTHFGDSGLQGPKETFFHIAPPLLPLLCSPLSDHFELVEDESETYVCDERITAFTRELRTYYSCSNFGARNARKSSFGLVVKRITSSRNFSLNDEITGSIPVRSKTRFLFAYVSILF